MGWHEMCQTLRHLAFGHGVQPDAPGTFECCKKESLTAQENIGESLDHLYIECDRTLEHGNVTRLNTHHLIWLQMILDRVAVQFGKCHAGTGQFLQNKAFPGEHSDTQSTRKENIQFHTFLRAQEGMFMHDHRLPCLQFKWQDLAGEVC